MLAGRIVLVLERLRRSMDEHTVAAAYFRLGSGISSHEEFRYFGLDCLVPELAGKMHRGESDAPLFGRPATVVRDGCDIADDGYLEPYGLHRANRRFPARPRAFYANLDFSQPVAHCLLAGILGDHLRGVGGALARTLEAAFARARPSDDSAFRSVILTMVLLKLA